MTILQAIVLGIVQGLTEFLPVSSSAHLVLVPDLLNWQIPPAQIFPFDVLVQLGTVVAVMAFFWQDLWAIIRAWVSGLMKRQPFAEPQSRLGWYLISATIPAGLAGVLFKDQVEQVFHSPTATALFLLVTAALLALAEWLGKRNRSLEVMNWKDALTMGLMQVLSLLPGVSRSGSTISGGMFRGLDRAAAARFSFLMSVPVMLGAGLVGGRDLLSVPDLGTFLPVMIIGFVTAAVVGYFSIAWLLRFLTRRSFYSFAIYCVAFAALSLLVGALR
ncbi:MAG TPA: undecaprenyl-diphosphatase UppP [Anaerolineaceae bacterium]|jgi:undecaprenyl-diphosphatase|nr:undecaprenyl-diphosphatase UppP [Anaerolineaceae bacterium]